jgi:hypothetical protein
MRAFDVRNIVRFNTRMGMYICPSDRAGVAAFLRGYECAAAGACRFTAALSAHLAKRHRAKAGSLGWPDRIARLAGRRSLDWMEVYLLVSSEVLSAAAEGLGAEPAAAADGAPEAGSP